MMALVAFHLKKVIQGKLVSQCRVASARFSSSSSLPLTRGNRRELFSILEPTVPNQFTQTLDEDEFRFYKLLNEHQLISEGLLRLTRAQVDICEGLTDGAPEMDFDIDYRMHCCEGLKTLSATEEKLLFMFEVTAKEGRNLYATLTKERINKVRNIFHATENPWEINYRPNEVIEKFEQQFEELKGAEKENESG